MENPLCIRSYSDGILVPCCPICCRRKLTVVVTDGFSRIGPEYIKKRADEIKARGIEMFSLGITRRTNDEELTALSSKPVKNHFLRLTNNKAVKG